MSRFPACPTVHLNGKFAAQAVTGVQRVGRELVIALDALLAAGSAGGPRWILHSPPGAQRLPLRSIDHRIGQGPLGSLHVWEQLQLPLLARDGLLVNLAGTGPWWTAAQVVLHHDAAVFDQPAAYTPLFRHWYRQLFRRQARNARALLSVSDFSRERLAHWLGQSAERWQTLHLGADHLLGVDADTRLLERHQLQPGRFLLAVGSANPTKNQALLVAAHARLRAPQVPLVLVGGGNDQVFAAEGVLTGAAQGCDAPVIRLGRVDDAALKALYQAALGLIFPSRYEGFGLPPLEAMSLGCPVLVSDCASLPEVCGAAALQVHDPLTEEELSAALQRLVDDTALRGRLAEAGRAHAAGFRWAKAARQLHDTVLRALPCAGLESPDADRHTEKLAGR